MAACNQSSFFQLNKLPCILAGLFVYQQCPKRAKLKAGGDPKGNTKRTNPKPSDKRKHPAQDDNKQAAYGNACQTLTEAQQAQENKNC
ncbi:MAG: hypothetical protein QM727_12120 [Niabella sp.]